MRVTTQQTYVSMTQSFNNLSGDLAHVVEQMATGKEILQPSDDPIAATRITQLNRQQSAIEQYQSNIDSASAGLSQQESILDGVNNSLLAVRDDLLEAANGTNTPIRSQASGRILSRSPNQWWRRSIIRTKTGTTCLAAPSTISRRLWQWTMTAMASPTATAIRVTATTARPPCRTASKWTPTWRRAISSAAI